MEVTNSLSILQAVGLIAGVCGAAFAAVLVKIAVKESRRITRHPVQMEIPTDQTASDEQRGLREGAALAATYEPVVRR
jgi:hypothetical protein